MGRHPIELTEAQKAEVETLAAVLSAEQVADYFGIGRTTFFSIMGRDPEIAERYKRGKARAIGSIAQSLIAKARGGDTASMIFYLKTQAGWRETQHVEVAVEESGMAALSASMTTVEIARRAAYLLKHGAEQMGHLEGYAVEIAADVERSQDGMDASGE